MRKGVLKVRTPALHLIDLGKLVAFCDFGLNLRGSACMSEAQLPFSDGGF
jgi:hypothetical protein